MSSAYEEALQRQARGPYVQDSTQRQAFQAFQSPYQTPYQPPVALHTLLESMKTLRSSVGMGLDMKLSDVRAAVVTLMPLVSMPVWLPFSFMLSIFSYFAALVLQALDASEPGGHGLPWGPTQGRPVDAFKFPALSRMSSATSLPGVSGNRGSSSSSILRALDQVLELVTALPPSSSKYNFTRTLAEQLLVDNTVQKPPLVDLNRMALVKAFRRTVEQLETCLLKGASGPGRWNALLRRCSQAAGLSSPLCSTDLASTAPTPLSMRAEKLSQELRWLADKLFEYGGGADAFRLWASAPALAEASRGASSRVQASLVQLSALFVRAVAGTEWTVSAVLPRESVEGSPLRTVSYRTLSEALCGSGSPSPTAPPAAAPQPLASLDLQYHLLLLWLPLMCRAIHSGDGPILSTSDKQRTEEALQHTILQLSHSEQEVLFASWLHEYSWSASDWPNLQNQYVAWCERARRVACISDNFEGLE